MPPIDLTRIEALLSQAYGIDAALSRVAGENENYLVIDRKNNRYVLKLAGVNDTDALIDLEREAVEAAAAADLGIELPRIIAARDGKAAAALTSADGQLRLARLLSFVPGTAWCRHSPAPPRRLDQTGDLIGRLAKALAGVSHPAAQRTHCWDLTATEGLRATVGLVHDSAKRRLLDQAFVLFAAAAKPYLGDLPHALIHGDLNDDNLLVEQNRVSGLLDFGDCLFNPMICDLAIALAYLLLDEPEPLAAGAAIVTAYHRQRPLAVAEIEVLFPLMCGRLAASLAICAERRVIDPERQAWFVTEERAWRALERYLSVDPLQAADQLAQGTGLVVFTDRGAPAEALLTRRRAHFCEALSLSYARPLKFVRGRGQYLLDERGRPYLDLYNNVCHVGHCHPRVVAAGQEQMARLNTNTRYLGDPLVDYAERLCATLPDELCYCFLVNSGSEANELALRLARAYTGHKDLLVVDNAYHGHTSTLIDISPYKFMGRGGTGRAEPWVHVVQVPDGYRGPYKGLSQETGRAYGDAVGRLIAELERPIAGFISESLLSCGGQVIPPKGYFETAFRHVRKAGGVCILDEVQVGFGRTGTHFWAFEMQSVIPDIVVMGKPMGNGHPMAAVVTTRPIARCFADTGMEFFATFGGNPVSCAIGTAVLDVIVQEGLQQNALQVGNTLRDGLQGLMERHPLVGDVRGAGLFIGMELVKNRSTLEPATAQAAAVVNALTRRRILTGTDGPYDNVIKIKPPLVLTREDAAAVVDAFDDVLAAIAH